MATGIAKAESVTIANQMYHLVQDSVNLSSVTPNEILLILIAKVDRVNPVAPK